MAQHSPLARMLRALLDDTNIFNRNEWAMFLGVTPGALSQWVSDRTIPRPSTFRMLVGFLRERANIPQRPLQDLAELLSKPSSIAAPKHAKKIGRTLQDYLTRPVADGLLARFLATLHSLPPEKQEDFLQRTAAALPGLVNPEEAEYFRLVEAYPPGKTIDEADLMEIVTRRIWQRVDVVAQEPYELVCGDEKSSGTTTYRLPVLNLYQASVRYLVERCGASLRYIVSEANSNFGESLSTSIPQLGFNDEFLSSPKSKEMITAMAVRKNVFDDLVRRAADRTSVGDAVTPSIVVIFDAGERRLFG